MQHDVSAFHLRNTHPAQDEPIVEAAPPGVTPGTMRGILIGLPIAAMLWGVVLVAIWLLLHR